MKTVHNLSETTFSMIMSFISNLDIFFNKEQKYSHTYQDIIINNEPIIKNEYNFQLSSHHLVYVFCMIHLIKQLNLSIIYKYRPNFDPCHVAKHNPRNFLAFLLSDFHSFISGFTQIKPMTSKMAMVVMPILLFQFLYLLRCNRKENEDILR